MVVTSVSGVVTSVSGVVTSVSGVVTSGWVRCRVIFSMPDLSVQLQGCDLCEWGRDLWRGVLQGDLQYA